MRAKRRQQVMTVLLASTLLATAPAATVSGATNGAWSWRTSGSLGRHMVCSTAGTLLSGDVCFFHVPNAPRRSGVVTGLVRIRNAASSVKCYGISISTAYMAGLHSFCVRAHSSGQYRTSGPSGHYRQTQLSVFVTNGSTTSPIQPMRDSGASPFSVSFSEPRP